MKRLLCWLAALTVILAVWSGNARAEEDKPVENFLSWQETIDKLDLQEMEQFKTSIDGEISGYLEHRSAREWINDFMTGQWDFNPKKIVGDLWKYFFREVLANGQLLGKILILTVISALLVNLQSSFDQGVAKISSMACFLAISAIALGSFKYVIRIGQVAIESMSDLMTAVLPQMMVLVTGLGHIHTAGAIFPLMMAACTAFARGIGLIVFPLIALSAILNLAEQLTDTIKLERLGKLLYTLAEAIMGLMLTFFVGILTLRSIYGSVMDAITLRTGKFVTDTFFPIIGGYLADALETAAGYVVLLKQAVGIMGLLTIFGIFIFPVIKIGVIALIYKVSSAVVEPLGDSRISQVLEVMGNHLLLVLAAVAAVGLMFFVLVAILVSTGNSVILLR
ncbi:MAG: stage III sporulation protein AE [Syntrophomonadaceae bacterium]|nr:stage III sporulation protein AE [Syntrophomonadaceae bacterium]